MPVDFLACTVGEQVDKELDAQVIIEYKAGANGAIAPDFVMRTPADGNTIWLTSVGAVAINPPLYDKLPYEPVRDLAPISLVDNKVELLVVGADNPANTGAEFIACAKRKKASATMALSGTGSVPHLAMELLGDVSKARLVHVPYKGAEPAIADVIAGHVDGFLPLFWAWSASSRWANSSQLALLRLNAIHRCPMSKPSRRWVCLV